VRSLWKGSISFGLVSIPIKLYAATEDRDLHFNMLHEPCRTPIRYVKMCPTCQKEVGMDEIVRGFEYEKGHYVILREEDFEAIPVAAARTLDIVDFVYLREIDPIYFDKTYYLEPGEGGGRAYHLLRRAMEETGRIAIARVVIRSREQLAAIRVYRENTLAMETMHYPDEIRTVAGLSGLEAVPELREQEMQMATQLIGSLAGEFVPEKFRNEYRETLIQLIQQRVAGQEVAQAPAQAARTRVVDLMEALRASIRVAEEAREKEEHAPELPAAGPLPVTPAVPGPGLPLPAVAAGAPATPIPGLPRAPGLPAAPPPPVPGVPRAPVPGPGDLNPPAAPRD
jgi:DNA end-binding protein Ku